MMMERLELCFKVHSRFMSTWCYFTGCLRKGVFHFIFIDRRETHTSEQQRQPLHSSLALTASCSVKRVSFVTGSHRYEVELATHLEQVVFGGS